MATNGIGLNQPLGAGGEARSYFFNGRMLSAEDLQREQVLREAGQRRLAQLVGCGIQRGLFVRGKTGETRLSIEPGLGVTPSGEVIETAGFTLDLANAAKDGRGRGGFADCASAFGGSGPLAGTHLLVLTPAWIAEGRAPTLLGDVGACNRNVERPALRARLVPLNVPSISKNEQVDLRNRLAYALLAPASVSADTMIGWIPANAAPTLGADDLPIAVLKVDEQAKVQWIDSDAVQRRLGQSPGSAADTLWPRSRRTEMEAFARQVSAQLSASDQNLSAQSFFMLPPLLLLDAKGFERWSKLFLPPPTPTPTPDKVDRERFARELDGGLEGDTVSPGNAAFKLFELVSPHGSLPGLFLLRLFNRPKSAVSSEAQPTPAPIAPPQPLPTETPTTPPRTTRPPRKSQPARAPTVSPSQRPTRAPVKSRTSKAPTK